MKSWCMKSEEEISQCALFALILFFSALDPNVFLLFTYDLLTLGKETVYEKMCTWPNITKISVFGKVKLARYFVYFVYLAISTTCLEYSKRYI